MRLEIWLRLYFLRAVYIMQRIGASKNNRESEKLKKLFQKKKSHYIKFQGRVNRVKCQILAYIYLGSKELR